MNVNRRVVERINEHVHEIARRRVPRCTRQLRP